MVSCSKEDTTHLQQTSEIESHDLKKVIHKHFGLISNNEVNQELVDNFNSKFETVHVYTNKNKSLRILLYINRKDSTYKIVKKAIDINGEPSLIKVINLQGHLVNSRFEFKNIEIFNKEKSLNISTFSPVTNERQKPVIDNNPGKSILCQREGEEDISQCYKRECEEFCDGFITCAALATNPQIHLLILAMCSC